MFSVYLVIEELGQHLNVLLLADGNGINLWRSISSYTGLTRGELLVACIVKHLNVVDRHGTGLLAFTIFIKMLHDFVFVPDVCHSTN